MTTRLVAEERARRSAVPVAVTPPRPARRYRDGDVMTVSFAVTPRAHGMLPLPEDAVRVGSMRRIAAARLRYCGLEAMASDVMIVVSELLTNSIMHSGATSITLGMAVRDGFLRISVSDRASHRPVLREPGADEESGRGLHILGLLVQEADGSWGTSTAGDTTWCHFPLPAGGPR